MFMSRVRIFAALIAAASAAPAYADETAPATEEAKSESRTAGAIAFAETLTADATKALLNEEASQSERLSAFQDVLYEGLALETIGKFMLGSTREEMSEAQLARYNEIFPNYITRLYAEQFDEIVGRPLTVLEARELGRRDVVVRTQFDRENGKPIKVDWRVRLLKTGERKAIDIIVQGVSIMLVKREEFDAFISANGVDALLDRLEAEAGA